MAYYYICKMDIIDGDGVRNMDNRRKQKMSGYTEIETRVCKAEALGSFEKITDQVIIIKGKIPCRMTLDECEKFYER